MSELVAVAQLGFIDGIGFDPFFRGLLSVLAAVVVLIGSTYLVIATNTGVRQGFLIAGAALFGWLFLMGTFWTIYGIGWKGDAPTWTFREINVDDAGDADDGLLFAEIESASALARSSDGSGLGDLGLAEQVGDVTDPDAAQSAALAASEAIDIGDWRYLVTSDAIRGEAQASVDAFLVEEGVFGVGEYVPDRYGAFIIDGKPILELSGDENWFAEQAKRVGHTLQETVLRPAFGEELIVVQVRGTIDQPTLPGQPPPVATADPDAPLVSVIMEHDRGGPFPSLFSGLRFKPARFALVSGLIFAAFAWNMHLRDQRESKERMPAA